MVNKFQRKVSAFSQKMNTFNNVEGKELWATINGRFAVVATGPGERDASGKQEPGDEVYLFLPTRASDTLFGLRLTELSWSEYENLRKILGTALKKAAPVIKMRDADAAKQFEGGEVGPARSYRPVSRMFNPEGEVK